MPSCKQHYLIDASACSKARWHADVLALRPDWVSVMIGINDVWRQFDRPLQTELAVGASDYEATLDQLIAQTKPRVRGLVLMTPFYLEPNRQDPMRAMVDRYGRIVRVLAARHGAILCDTQAAFDRLWKHVYPASIAWDRVHPNLTGHLILAQAFLRSVGFPPA